MDREITEPSDKTLKVCDLNDVLRLYSIRALLWVTRSNSRVSTKPDHLIKVIEDYTSTIKGDSMIELVNPDGTRNSFPERNT